MKKIVLLFLVVEVSNILQEHVASGCFMAKKVHIHIISNLPPDSEPLQIHCASRDDDLGDHFLRPDQVFEWSFCANFLPNTLFFCHFWWGPHDLVFDVYNEKNQGKGVYQNWWVVKSDGFYYSSKIHPMPLKRRFEWDD